MLRSLKKQVARFSWTQSLFLRRIENGQPDGQSSRMAGSTRNWSLTVPDCTPMLWRKGWVTHPMFRLFRSGVNIIYCKKRAGAWSTDWSTRYLIPGCPFSAPISRLAYRARSRSGPARCWQQNGKDIAAPTFHIQTSGTLSFFRGSGSWSQRI